jgi:hypothetical protein
MPITSIQITGYRGPKTDGRFLPAGEYRVGTLLDLAERIVPDDLARYLVETGQVIGFEVAGEHPSETAPVDPDDALPYFVNGIGWVGLDDLNVDDLRTFAEQHGIELPAGRMKKADLIELIIHAADQPDPDEAVQPNFGDDPLDEPDSE